MLAMLTLLVIAAGLYQLFAIVACLMFLASPKSGTKGVGPVSILKPVRGLDPAFGEAIQTHTTLDGNYEFLCGVRDDDPTIGLLRTFPEVKIVPVRTITPNGKVGALIDLAQAARNPILVVNDSDIRVEKDYLQRVTAPLAHPQVGLVTCLYRPIGDTLILMPPLTITSEEIHEIVHAVAHAVDEVCI